MPPGVKPLYENTFETFFDKKETLFQRETLFRDLRYEILYVSYVFYVVLPRKGSKCYLARFKALYSLISN